MQVTSPLSIMLISGEFDRIHYALSMATAAASLERKVTLCISLAACKAFTPDGWKALPLSAAMGQVAVSAEALDNYYAKQHIATFDVLLDATAELAIPCIACEMGMRASGLVLTDMDARLAWMPGGLISFYQQAGDGAIIVV
jgi:peroxiredoxin family protein